MRILGRAPSKHVRAQVLVSETRASFDAAKQQLEVVMPAAPLPPPERAGAETTSGSARCATLGHTGQCVQAGVGKPQGHRASEGEPEGSSSAGAAAETAAQQAANNGPLQAVSQGHVAATGNAAQGSGEFTAHYALPRVSDAVAGGAAGLHGSAMGSSSGAHEQLTLADMQALEQGAATAWQGPAAHTVITELDAGPDGSLRTAEHEGVLEQTAPAEEEGVAAEPPAQQGGAEAVLQDGCAAGPAQQGSLLAARGDGLTDNERLWRQVHAARDADESAAEAAGPELAPAVVQNGGQESHGKPYTSFERGGKDCEDRQPHVRRMKEHGDEREAARADAAGCPRSSHDPALPENRAQPRHSAACSKQGALRDASIVLKPRISNVHADELI